MADTADGAARAVRPARSFTVSRDALVATALLVVLVALVVFGVTRAGDVRAEAQDRSRGDAAVKAARTEVLALTTISVDTSDADIDRILAGATQGFRDQFEDQAKAFRAALVDSQVTSTGKIASAGLASLDDDKAQVLVAATGTVMNKDTADPQPRNYRLRVSLEQVDGTWLVAGMEFVA